MYLFDDVINDDFLYTEGSIKENLKKATSGNREIKENLKKATQEYREEIKLVNECKKNNDTDGMKSHLDKASTIVQKYKNVVKNTDTNVFEVIVASVLRDLIIFFKYLPLHIITGGLSSTIMEISDIINLIIAVKNDIDEGNFSISSLNRYRSQALNFFDKCEKEIKKIKTSI